MQPQAAKKSSMLDVNKESVLDVVLGRDSWHTMLSFLLGVRRSVERLGVQDVQLTADSFQKVQLPLIILTHTISSSSSLRSPVLSRLCN